MPPPGVLSLHRPSEQGLLLPNSLPKLCQQDLTQTFAKSSTPSHRGSRQ